jgi:hypothetical protein
MWNKIILLPETCLVQDCVNSSLKNKSYLFSINVKLVFLCGFVNVLSRMVLSRMVNILLVMYLKY